MPIVKSFHCPSCGAPIKDIKNPNVVCEYCGSTCCIEGLSDCLNIVKKENINSGINFEACADVLHKSIIDLLTANPCAPLDILESGCISGKENICVPAYYYHYNGTTDYLCDVCVENIKHLSGENGKIQEVKEASWSTISGNIRAEAQRIVAGNRNYDFVIDDFYASYRDGCTTSRENNFVDIESFLIPSNVESIPFNRPTSELLDAYVRPDMNEAFKNSVLKQIGNRKSRDISLGSSNIEKDGSIERLLISMYHINFTYNQNAFSLYASGDGKKIKFQGAVPIDPNRKNTLDSLNEAYKSADKKVSLSTFGIVSLSILMLILFVFINIGGLIAVPFIAFCIYETVVIRKKRTKLKENINQFYMQVETVRNHFLANHQKIQNYKILES